MTDNAFDLIVLGAGPGGYVAAIRAAQLGMKTAVVEEKHLGGVCLNWGCIPTKALLRSAEALELMRRAKDYGLAASGAGFDFAAIVSRSRAVAQRLSKGVAHLLKKNGVRVIEGRGRLLGGGRIGVSGKDGGAYSAKHIIVATGARPRDLPGLERDGRLVWSYFEALNPERLPKSLLIVGSGAIGMEFASLYNALGVEVTVVEIMERILPAEDAEIAQIARRQLEKAGIRILTGAKPARVEKGRETLTATIGTGEGKSETISVERALSAVGVVANIDDIGLEEAGVETEGGVIRTDGFLRTSAAGVYAIGDVAGPPMLAHKAAHEGVICVEKIAGVAGVRPLEREQIPACTYCHPQVASVGLTEEEAKARGHEVRVGRFPFLANGRAIALGDDQGLVKTVFDAGTGQLLGAHMVGPEVTEMIQGFVIAMKLETTEEELMHAVFPHPTLSEAMHESVLAAWGRAIHI